MKIKRLARAGGAVVAVLLPLAAYADNSVTLSSGTYLNLDTGATSTSASGDIQFTGTNIVFQGTAKGAVAPGFAGSTTYSGITETILQAFATLASSSPIPTSSLTAGDASGSIIGVLTNTGKYAKLLVTALSSSSVTFEYLTYGASGGGTSITSVMNNSSTIPAGFPNGGVAPSTIFVVVGTGMATPGTTPVLQNIYPTGTLPKTLNGTSLSVTVGGTTVQPAIYYSSPTQVAAELPANTPTGTGTLTVTYNSASATSPITVVPAAYGIDVYYGNYAVLQDSVTGAIITPTNSAKPGQIVTLWGTGLGADPGDSDVAYSSAPQKINTSIQINIGGVQVPAANIQYAGSLGYPGVNGIVFTVPSNVPAGCFDSVAVVTNGTVASNVAVASFMPNGGTCQDSFTGLSGDMISTLTGQTSIKTGGLIVIQSTSPATSGSGATVDDTAVATFQQVAGSAAFSTANTVSLGSCSLDQAVGNVTIPTITPLNAGTITVTPPGGSAVTLQTLPQVPGIYTTELPAGSVPTSGGTFSWNGSGSTTAPAVGAFSTTINFPNPILSWTNQSAAATVSRSAGFTATWSGGGAGTYVIVSGISTGSGLTGSFTCVYPQSALQGSVPSYILLSLPSGTGSMTVENSTGFSKFTATGIDFGFAFGAVSYMVNSTYQ